jgi:hypothetical protein
LSTLGSVGESAYQFRKHIEVLSEFERKYGAFLDAAHKAWEGEATWGKEEFAERQREIQKLAVRADLAMKASGVPQLYITYPQAMGGGIKSTDLPSQVFDFDPGFADDGMGIQRQIQGRIPSQIAGLEIRVEEAEARERKRAERPTLPKMPKIEFEGWGWVNHPWTITIVGTAVGGVIVAAILGAFH